MPTLDTLPADQRAIVELVVRRGQSYDDLAGMLDMRSSRVRELSRAALEALSPVTAARVDDQWRGQVADYMLGQQSGPEATATRGHLKRSEPARAWAYSLLDSLDDWFSEERYPSVPEPESGRSRTKERPRERERAADGTTAPALPSARPTTDLSPAAQAEVRRRRLLMGGGLALVAAILIGTLLFTGGDEDSDSDRADTNTNTTQNADAPQGEAQLLAQAALTPVEEGGKGQGVAVVAENEGRPQLVVQAELQPTKRGEAYETWLYNSQEDAVSLGAQVPDAQGRYQGAAQSLPENYERFKFVDISLEGTADPVDPAHSGNSVVRGELAPPTEGAQPGAQGAAPQGAAPQGAAPAAPQGQQP